MRGYHSSVVSSLSFHAKFVKSHSSPTAGKLYHELVLNWLTYYQIFRLWCVCVCVVWSLSDLVYISKRAESEDFSRFHNFLPQKFWDSPRSDVKPSRNLRITIKKFHAHLNGSRSAKTSNHLQISTFKMFGRPRREKCKHVFVCWNFCPPPFLVWRESYCKSVGLLNPIFIYSWQVIFLPVQNTFRVVPSFLKVRDRLSRSAVIIQYFALYIWKIRIWVSCGWGGGWGGMLCFKLKDAQSDMFHCLRELNYVISRAYCFTECSINTESFVNVTGSYSNWQKV